VTIIARAQVGPVYLRARLDEIAREFGVQVAELNLNGSFIDHLSGTGGPHGHRTR
jgi:hypothetical protein